MSKKRGKMPIRAFAGLDEYGRLHWFYSDEMLGGRRKEYPIYATKRDAYLDWDNVCEVKITRVRRRSAPPPTRRDRMRFRKKPIVIEAFEYRQSEHRSGVAQYVIEGRVRYTQDGTMLIQTLEGVMEANPGDWIIRGVKGELYPCKPDIFAATYEPAE